MDDVSPPPTFSHARLLVDDYPACFAFYRDVLGFDATWGDADSGYADFDTGETTLAIHEREGMVAAVDDLDRSSGDGVAVIFRVDSVDDTYDRLRSDVAFVSEPHDQPTWGIRVVHCRDPDGTLVEFNEPIEHG